MDGTGLSWTAGQESEPVWVSDEAVSWKAGVLESVGASGLKIQTVDGKYVTVETDKEGKCVKQKVLPRDVGPRSKGVDNMDNLTHLHEGSILHNVCKRFENKKIYTRTGPILVAMNPFEWLPIYGDTVMKKYQQASDALLDEMDPHPYAEAERAFRGLSQKNSDQSLIICGESGSGKTETTKLMLQYLVSNYTGDHGGTIADRIMKSNPVMEAFGNAKTLRNNNSSRFGKFIKLYCDNQAHVVTSAHVSQYLLEKSRAVAQNKGERNYHIFYQLCKGADAETKSELSLGNDALHTFKYLNQSGCLQVEGIDDCSLFKETMDALAAIGVSEAEMGAILRVLAGILHLGNASFEKPSEMQARGTHQDEEESKGESDPVQAGSSSLALASKLFKVKSNDLMNALTTRHIIVNGKTISSPLDGKDAGALRDALSKSVYQRLFTHVVQRVNESLDPRGDLALNNTGSKSVGILDIYGFESFQENGFDQLLINFANENLQGLFNDQVFQAEEKMYDAEQVPFSQTDFPNNDKCLSLMNGIFKLMHDECLRMNAGSDKSLASHITQRHKSEPHFVPCGPGSKKKNTGEYDFCIKHYAGDIVYTCNSFVSKNRDTLYGHVRSTMATSECDVMRALFADSVQVEGGSRLQRSVAKTFASQVNDLTAEIRANGPIFVRCIKSNNSLKPRVVDHNSVLEQLINAGVVAALEMRRVGFPNRLLYRDFVMRCRALLPKSAKLGGDANYKALATTMLEHEQIQECVPGIALGKTKIFLRANILHIIDGVVQHLISAQVILAQSMARMFVARCCFLKKQKLALWTQTHFRGRRDRIRCAEKIEALKRKREWIARASAFDQLERQLRDAIVVADELTRLVQSVPGAEEEAIERHSAEIGIDRLIDCLEKTQDGAVQAAREQLGLRESLEAADSALSKLSSKTQECVRIAESAQAAQHELETKAASLRTDVAQIQETFAELVSNERSQESYFRNSMPVDGKGTAISATQLFGSEDDDPLAPQEDNVVPDDEPLDDVIDRFANGYKATRANASESIESARVSLMTFDVVKVGMNVEIARSQLNQAVEILERAKAAKAEMDLHFEQIMKDTESIKDQFVRVMQYWFKSVLLQDVVEVQSVVDEAKKGVAELIQMTNGSDSDAARETVVALMQSARDDLSEFGDEDDESKARGGSRGIIDLDRLDAVLANARFNIQQTEELLGRAGAMAKERHDAISRARSSRRQAEQIIHQTMQEHASFSENTILFNTGSVRKSLSEAQTWTKRCENATARVLGSIDPTESAITAEIHSCAEEALARATKFQAEIGRVRAKLDRAVAAQQEGRKRLLPALDVLREARAQIQRHGLGRNRDIQNALRCAEKELEEADRLLEMTDRVPSSASIETIPEVVSATAEIITMAAELVKEETQVKARMQGAVQDARSRIMAVTGQVGRLEARIQENPVFEQRSLNALCKASSCGAQVCAKANELARALEHTNLALSRASSKLAKLQSLEHELTWDEAETERKIVNDLILCATQAETGCASALEVLDQVIDFRARELEKLNCHRRKLSDIESRFARARDMNAAISPASPSSRRGGLLHLQRAFENTKEFIGRYRQAVNLLTIDEEEDESDSIVDNGIEWVNPTIYRPEVLYTDSIKVLMFANQDPIQVLKEAQMKALRSLEEVEQVVETGRSIVEERSKLRHLEQERQIQKSIAQAREREANEERVRQAREVATTRLERAKRTVTVFSEVCRFCESRLESSALVESCAAAVSQMVHVYHCLSLVEKAISENNADRINEQVDIAVEQAAILEELIFGNNPPQPSRADVQGTQSAAAWSHRQLFQEISRLAPDASLRANAELAANGDTMSSIRQTLDLAKAKLKATKAQIDLYSFESESKAADIRSWRLQELVVEAEASLECAYGRLSSLSSYAPTTFVALQCLDKGPSTGTWQSQSACGLKDQVEQLKASTQQVDSIVNKVQVGFERSLRRKSKQQAKSANVKRLVLKYICPKDDQ